MSEWPGLLWGVLAGAGVSALFFAGLAVGVRIALKSRRPTTILIFSAAVRMALLLAAGWFIASLGYLAVLGFAVSFLGVRLASAALVRFRIPEAGVR